MYFCTVLFVSISQVIGCNDHLRNDNSSKLYTWQLLLQVWLCWCAVKNMVSHWLTLQLWIESWGLACCNYVCLVTMSLCLGIFGHFYQPVYQNCTDVSTNCTKIKLINVHFNCLIYTEAVTSVAGPAASPFTDDWTVCVLCAAWWNAAALRV